MTELALFDANILIYSLNRTSPFFKPARDLVEHATVGKLTACLTQQVLWGFFAVVTDKRRIENPITPLQAEKEITTFWTHNNIIRILPHEDTVTTTLRLINQYNITCQDIHDAYLVATMLDNDVHTLYSGDETMSRFREITVINPFR